MSDPMQLQVRLRRLTELLPALQAKGAESAFGAWVASRRTEPGVWTMPYVDYGPLERAFHAACAGWVRPDIDWMAWAGTADALALERDPARLARATPEEIACLLTALVRGDRFNEGMLLDAFRTGLLSRIASRAAILANAPRDGSA
jgi:hypothetical protein